MINIMTAMIKPKQYLRSWFKKKTYTTVKMRQEIYKIKGVVFVFRMAGQFLSLDLGLHN